MTVKSKKIINEAGLTYLKLTAGALMYAAGVGLFLDPNNLAPGGISGVAVILHELIATIPTGTLIILINIPIMILGWVKFGFKFIISTLYVLFSSSFLINVFQGYVGALTENLFLACVAGSCLMGVGIGIVFLSGGTTGGSDIIVKLLRRKFRYLNTGVLFFISDAIVVTASGFVFKDIDVALYAGISVLIQMFVINMVLYGGDEARMVYIISESKDKISGRILTELESGATFLEGKGAYTGNKYEVLMVVVRMRTLPQLRDIVINEDKKAFMIVTSATAVFGEGYKGYDSEEL